MKKKYVKYFIAFLVIALLILLTIGAIVQAIELSQPSAYANVWNEGGQVKSEFSFNPLTWINPSLNENQRPAPNSAIIST